MWSSDAASIAPVLPAETSASASPSATARTARTSDESGFARTASTGDVVHADARSGLDEGQPVGLEPARPEENRLDLGDAAAAAPATISSGARSPPSASTATRIMPGSIYPGWSPARL